MFKMLKYLLIKNCILHDVDTLKTFVLIKSPLHFMFSFVFQPIEFTFSVAILDTLAFCFLIQVSLNMSLVCACCVYSASPIFVM